ncbi:MAG: RluA family pseudouridine synthase [Alphaproteobacteria bacterium]|nr:RluA family pseudouridine synthase [Alphaproteobacteria bacterium]MBL0718158.1 RluA family pseudouridine synthase [Alphaproteobacteria bacterium]
MEYKKHKLLEKDTPTTLLKWMERNYPDVVRSLVYKSIRKGLVKLNGKKTTSNVRLNEGDELSVSSYVSQNIEKTSQTKSLSQSERGKIRSWIIYEDSDIVVLNKPGGVACQGGSKVVVSLDGLLCDYYSSDEIRLVHRLDKDTSGLMVVSKNLRSAQNLGLQFKEKEVSKVYVAVVIGDISKKLSKADVVKTEEESGRESITEYKILSTRSDYDLTLIELKPRTGRKHQLRKHMSYSLGLPILGDRLYGKDILKLWYRKHEIKSDLLLSSIRLTFTHPTSGERMDINYDVEGGIEKFFNLRNYYKFGKTQR